MRTLVFAAVVLSAIVLGGVTFAQSEAESHAGAAAEGEAGTSKGHHHVPNMWSWDYGPTPKDPTHKDWPPPFGFAFLNFAVFLGIMLKLGGPGIRDFVATRHDKIKHELDEAGRLRREAQAQLDELSKRLSNLDAEVAKITTTVRAEAEEEKARIIAAAAAQAVRVGEEADRQIKAEIERQRAELGRVVVEAALQQAETLLTKTFTPDDQRRVSENYVAQLEKGNA